MVIISYTEWVQNGLKIFIVVFIIGKIINTGFRKFQKWLRIPQSRIYGFVHLFFVLSFSYFLHILTSDQFSDEVGISSPSVLFSGLFMGLQNNMFYNLGV
jgi:hypothetical protein